MSALDLLVREFCGPQPGEVGAAPPAPSEYEPWLRQLFPKHVGPLAERHRELWEWVWSIEDGVRPRPFVAAWPRGGGKSTSCELGAVALGARGLRRYVLYVRETQDNADKSVLNVASLLESKAVELYYPQHAQRSVGKFGSARGWRRNRLWTAGGLVIDAIGLDTAARGVKVEEQRPDVIIFDDIDGKHDSKRITRKKREIITTSILPSGTDDTAILGVQNLIIPNGIFSQLVDGHADFLVDRIVSGPFPAVEGLKTEPQADPETGQMRSVIIAGRATWEGQNLAACQQQIDTFGLSAFLEECQHQVHEKDGALWTKAMIERTRVREAPSFRRIVVAMDPAATSTGDENGIVVAGLGDDGQGYLLEDLSEQLAPAEWAARAVGAYRRSRPFRTTAS